MFWGYSKWWRIFRLLEAWTEVCHQFFAGWEMQILWNFLNVWNIQRNIMFSNGLNMVLLIQARVKQTVHREKTLKLSGKKKVLGAAVSKDYTDSVLGHQQTYHKGFPWKRSNCKQCFLLPTSKTKFTLSNESHTHTHTHTYIYIYIYGKSQFWNVEMIW